MNNGASTSEMAGTSDYRSPSVSQQNSTSKQTYASLTKTKTQQPLPKKEQAIVFNAIDGIQIKEYIIKIGNTVEPKNIIFASRISNNRICIYLKDKETVDKLLETKPELEINNTQIQIRRLITPAQRVIISNVCPTIPNENIERALKSVNLTLASPINHMRAGIQEDGYSHILSFRRVAFITNPENKIIPSSLMIPHEDTNYRIFLTEENFACYICKKPGHVANKCPNQHVANPTETIAQKRNADVIEAEETNINTSDSGSQSHTSISDTEDTLSQITKEASTNKKIKVVPTKNKKQKTESQQQPMKDENKYESIKADIDKNPNKYMLNYNTFKTIMDNIKGNKEQLAIAQEYTDNIPGLIEMMTKLYTVTEHRSVKSRLTRVMRNLNLQLKRQLTKTAPQEQYTTQTRQEQRISQEQTQLTKYNNA